MSSSSRFLPTFFLFFLCLFCVFQFSSAIWPCPVPPSAPGEIAVPLATAFVPQHKSQAEWYYVVGSLCEGSGEESEYSWWGGGRQECDKKVGYEATLVMMNVSLANGSSVITPYITLELNFADSHYATTVLGLPPIYPNPMQPFDLSFATDPPLYTTTYTLLSGTPGVPGSIYNLVANTPNMTLNFILRSDSPLFRHGNNGYVSYNAQVPPLCNTFNYVSMPRMQTFGTVRLNNDIKYVSGVSWFDHQWGVFGKTELGQGWIWMGLRIGGINFMMSVPRFAFHLNYTRSAVEAQDADNGSITFGKINNIEVITNWTSPRTHFIYPVQIRLFTTHPLVRVLRLDPYWLNQEVTTILNVAQPQLPIWEGDVKVTVEHGEMRGECGDGQLELVGFTRLG